MTTVSEDASADLKQRIAELERRLEAALIERDAAIDRQTASALVNFRLQNELRAALDRQKAGAEILRSIAATAGNAAHALQEIAETTARFFNASSVTIRISDGLQWTWTIRVGPASERIDASVPSDQLGISGKNVAGLVYRENRQIHIPDLDNVDPAIADFPVLAVVRDGGTRTVSGTPLRRGSEAIGAMIIHRDRLAAFTDEELALQQSFADQAVIAIENARLFNETQAALARQTATSDILRIISGSPTDVQPVFDAIVQTAVRLLGCEMAFILRCDGVDFWAVARCNREGLVPVFNPRHTPIDPGANFPSRAIVDKTTLHLPDWSQIEIPEFERRIQEALGYQSAVYLPLLRQGECIGVLGVSGTRPRMFGETEIALAESFRDQAVIAIENTRLFNETQEALERQTATADILKVIASNPSNVQPVFEAIVNSAAKLFEPCAATIITLSDGMLHSGATTALQPNFDAERVKSLYPVPFDPDRAPSARAILERRIIEISDATALDAPEYLRRIALASGMASFTFVPLIHEGKGIGTIVLTSPQIGFRLSERQLALVQTFADQAVIAIQNTRLFNETREALERQTATADILKVIASSPSDVQPVFEAIAASANRLIGGHSTAVFRFIDGIVHIAAFTPTTPEADDVLKNMFPMPVANLPQRNVLNGETDQIHDTEAGEEFQVRLGRARGFRSIMFTPLMHQGGAIGMIAITRAEPGQFADHHVQLLKTFADQAVIAIENTRLFNETEEALERQTATAEVLQVINSSPGNLAPVFDAILEKAHKLCGAAQGSLQLYDGSKFRAVAVRGLSEAFANRLREGVSLNPNAPGPHLLKGARFVQIPDLGEIDDPMSRAAFELAGIRTVLFIPLRKDGTLLGRISASRSEVRLFTEKEIGLLESFAAQAVIAIENARLFNEVQAKTRDLEESLQQQIATSEVLQVISSKPGELGPVFQSMLENATRICSANFGALNLFDGEAFTPVAHFNTPPEFSAARLGTLFRPHPESGHGQVARHKEVVHIADLRESQAYRDGSPSVVSMTDVAGARTIVIVPMLKEAELIGTLAIYRQEVRTFNDKQIALLSNFANQAVIAIENTRLLKELQQRTEDLTRSLDDLRTAQDRLIQTEKLASLGQLTAGIAHEIKNPLNFVNNFAALSAELTDELKASLKPAVLDETIRAEVDELTGLLKDNLDKVVQHGKRADSIVKNMLLHSREGSGEHRPADINALVDESLNLAYHGARAEKPHFNVTLTRDFDPEAGMIEVFPQEITRVFLNLISNGFYAVSKRKAEHADTAFEPTVTASTKGAADHVEIRIRDNGTGIPPDVKERMFNPFFTTKPAGEGTGLGLSMSHDIIVKQHGGTIEVDTQPGEFTEFTIVLPRTSNLK
ncbi:MAG TPA: GAF domain-containing protein [Bradyrhizobium sp.]|uniref:GAF domain-containing sensor histidine kinase n=1 Tax=Bradyrhizobium sp. TaxID=376 RepID=UPI002C164487|nr:GAF domain-containing protein [Bradyrhizobium sp.]HLZ04699.1 GAF domain-containing protein [Bradyrhizobium sp.]